MGLGKTLTALVAARALVREAACRIVVVAPSGLHAHWRQEAAALQLRLELLSWAQLPADLPEAGTVLIADEAHYAQNISSQRTRAFLRLSRHPRLRVAWLLTGTPMKNGRPAQLFPLLAAIGHPLAHIVRAKLSREDLLARLGLAAESRIVVLLPGSRKGEVARHVPDVVAAAQTLRDRAGAVPILALPGGFGAAQCDFLEPFRAASIQVVEGLTWDVLAHADLALAAHLSALDYYGEVPWTDYPPVTEWYIRMKSRPSFRPLLADRVPGQPPVPHYAELDF